jgi:hypothetical protein
LIWLLVVLRHVCLPESIYYRIVHTFVHINQLRFPAVQIHRLDFGDVSA